MLMTHEQGLLYYHSLRVAASFVFISISYIAVQMQTILFTFTWSEHSGNMYIGVQRYNIHMRIHIPTTPSTHPLVGRRAKSDLMPRI
jgi:hypothetical protein